MPLTDDEATLFASWFHALSDPTRIRILNLLSTTGDELGVGTIVDTLALRQSTASHHLKVLHDVGFLRRRRHGTSVLYRVNANCLERFPSAADLVMGRLRVDAAPTAPGWVAEPA
ncbi:winged helix-turn-helix transcriptional regulator [Phycicoccus endophyticus]|uniref:Winged helix-turn-helix transcriptional regulator n=2 Tax=Phycicoccus endophyticus TaxID=1690220 RepID=A0A7G9R5Z9_9MICO|nr:winged helix-turn-helix transcriptional regulator [Phycicoccus endophyticus]QNN51024.1 winged helix-turn-helix transcriptional regulator [Phycicoccus endophyticus]GGL32442.1 transcriptional regulator [Phycicoccus endophyticus]